MNAEERRHDAVWQARLTVADGVCLCPVLLFSSAPRRQGCLCRDHRICMDCEQHGIYTVVRRDNTSCVAQGVRVVAGVSGDGDTGGGTLIVRVVSLSCLPLGGLFSSFVSVCLSLLPRIYNSLSPFYTLSPKLQAFPANFLNRPPGTSLRTRHTPPNSLSPLRERLTRHFALPIVS